MPLPEGRGYEKGFHRLRRLVNHFFPLKGEVSNHKGIFDQVDIDAVFPCTIFIASVMPVAIGFILDKLFPLPYDDKGVRATFISVMILCLMMVGLFVYKMIFDQPIDI